MTEAALARVWTALPVRTASMWTDIQDKVAELWADARFRTGLILVGSIIAAYLIEFIFRRTLSVAAARTKTELDDKIIAALKRPVFWSVILAGLAWAISLQVVSGRFVIYGLIKTLAVFIWTVAGIRVAEAVLTTVSARGNKDALIQTRTLPVFDMLAKVVLISVALYFTFLAWKINVSAWLASASIVGVAIGLAAQHTLSNLIAGISILADGIYKVGDFIVLDDGQGLRGRVTRIGMRSTRILTLDDVEITVPNAMIGSSKIINEVGGPSVRQRIPVDVSVAYGSDIDRVIEVLAECPQTVEGVCNHPVPQIRLCEFGASGLNVRLLVWITEPALRDEIVSQLNVAVYKALNAAGIEIPYSKHDLYIKEMPTADER